MPFLAGLRQDYTIYFLAFKNRHKKQKENFKKLENKTRKFKGDSLKDI